MTPNNLQLLSHKEVSLRISMIAQAMERERLDYILIGDLANLYYLTGRIFLGYILIGRDQRTTCWLRRPSILECKDNVYTYRRFDELMQGINTAIGTEPATLGLTFDDTPYSSIERLASMLGPGISIANASGAMRVARAVKTPLEQELMTLSGKRQALVYSQIAEVFHNPMTDIEFQIEIERLSRINGCLGLTRTSGFEMEIGMGSVLTGDNADAPSPYDFALGGAGLNPSLPVGANGTPIEPHKPVMVDMCGNYTGYQTDMTRCYCYDTPDPLATKACNLSASICRRLAQMMVPGTPCKDLYFEAERMVLEANMEAYFMGHTSHAAFVGHGVGITLNESPVLAPRSRDVLQAGNCIAVEPKFVLPGIGAVGIENTYLVTPHDGGLCLTEWNEEIQRLD